MSLQALQHAAIAIDHLGREDSFDIRRFPNAGYVEGKWNVGASLVVPNVLGTVYHMSTERYGKVLDALPEGDKSDEYLVIWSREEIRAISDTVANPDIIIWKGADYKVLHVWPRYEAGYYRALCGRVNERSNVVD